MTRRLGFSVGVAFVVLLAALLLCPAFAFADTATVLHDDFSSFQPSVWQTYFYSTAGGLHGISGTTSTVSGALTLRPSEAGGIAALQSVDRVVTSLPAHVQFKVRYSGSGFRKCEVNLAEYPAYTVFPGYPSGYPWVMGQEMRFEFGSTAYTTGNYPSLSVSDGGSGEVKVTSASLSLLPQNVWLTGDVWLYADHIEATIGGVDLSVQDDVASRLSHAGGLHLFLDTFDDAGANGMDVDDVLVEQTPAVPGHIRGTVRNSAGAPLPGIVVGAWKEPEAQGQSIALATQTVTAADGSYEMTTTLPGWYAVSFDDPTDAYRDETFRHTALPIEWGWAIPVGASEEATGVDAVLTSTSWLSTHRAIRVSGGSRYDTAIAISRQNFTHADTVVLATGAGYADACAAAPLCGAYYAPLLLTTRYSLPANVLGELQRLGTKDVFVVGSKAVVDDAVLTYLRDRGYTVTRIWGADRYETAAAIVRYLMDQDVPLADRPFVVRGDNFPDALAVSPFAYAEVRPVLLVRPTSAPASTISLLDDLGADHLYVVGSKAAVGDAALQQLADGTRDLYVYRISGNSRYQTAAALVDAWYIGYDNLGLATGADFPDALTGGIGQGEHWGGLLLSPPTALDGSAASIIANNGPYLWPVQCYGGTKALSDTVLTQAGNAVGTSFFEFEDEYGRLGVLARSAKRAQWPRRQGERPAGPKLPVSETYRK